MAMYMNFGLPALPPFDADADHASLGSKWKSWRDRFTIYLDAAGIENDKQKRALLLHLSGKSVQKVVQGLTDTGESYKIACDKLDEYFLPKMNARYERYVFKQARQEPGESVDRFATRLWTLSLACEYINSDDAIADQVLEKCTSNRLKRSVLHDTDTSLASILQIGRAMKRADTQVRSMEQPMSRDNHVNSLTSIKCSATREQQNSMRNKTAKSRSCFNCGGEWPHDNQMSCPAFGQTCHRCSKKNHFQKVCRSGKQPLTTRSGQNGTVRTVHEQPTSEERIYICS